MTAVSVEAIGVESVQVRLREMNGQVRQALIAAVTVQAAQMVQVVKEDKLSGQVLGQRTRRLRDSIHDQVTPTGSGVQATVGSDVAYAAFWEYGFQGTEAVREHLRHITQAFGRPITGRDVLVSAHSRKVDAPARSFLRSTLAEREPIILAAIEQAVQQAANP